MLRRHGRAGVSSSADLLTVLVAAALAVVVLAPLLVRRGTVLLHDMVFVPRQPLGADELGLGTSLPRSVPSDAVVSVLSTLVDGALVQRVALTAVLIGAAVGAARLCPAVSRLGRCAAAIAYAWNPWVAERLVIGHWALLVGYAALPWVVQGALAARAGRPGAVPRTLLAVGVASVTATGGLLAAALVAAGAGRRFRGVLLIGVIALQAPWLVAGALHPGGARSDPLAVEAFAVRAENWSGVLGSVLGLGGIWNAQVVPGSRETVVAPLATLAVLLVAAAGAGSLTQCWGRAPAIALTAVAAGGLLLSLAGAVPGSSAVLRALVEHVPGAGLLRDGQKWLAPLALLLAVAVGLGVERVAAVRSRVPLAVMLAVIPVAATPDLAWGAAGRLQPVSWPEDWREVRGALEEEHPGAVVSLPFSAYRAYEWNQRRPSLDPAPRWFEREVVVDDRLRVGDVVLAGEDRRSRDVAAALASGRPLGELGVGWVLVQHRTPGDVPATATEGAELVHDGPDLSLWRVPDVRSVDVERPPDVPVVVAHVLALSVLCAALVAVLRRRLGSVGA